MPTSNAEEHDSQTDCSSAAPAKCTSRAQCQYQQGGPPSDLRLKYGPIGLRHAAKSIPCVVRHLRAIVTDCLSMLANLLWAAQCDLTLKPSQQIECEPEQGLPQGLTLPPCKLASLRIALGIFIHMLLDRLKEQLGSLGQQQQLELPAWYTHSSMLTACDLMKLALLVVTTCGVCADISRMLTQSSSASAPCCTVSSPPVASHPTACAAHEQPSHDHEKGQEGQAGSGRQSTQPLGNQLCTRSPEEEKARRGPEGGQERARTGPGEGQAGSRRQSTQPPGNQLCTRSPEEEKARRGSGGGQERARTGPGEGQAGPRRRSTQPLGNQPHTRGPEEERARRGLGEGQERARRGPGDGQAGSRRQSTPPLGNQPHTRGPEEERARTGPGGVQAGSRRQSMPPLGSTRGLGEASLHPELCAAESSCPSYRSRYNQRYRVTVKVPADVPELPDISTLEVQARLAELSPSLHVQRLGVRSGCIILELECVDLQPSASSSPSSRDSSAASLLSDAGWLELLNVHGIASDALAKGEPLVVSLLVNDRSAQLSYDPATGAWTQLPEAVTGPSPAALQLRPQCLVLDSQVARVSLVGRGIAADGNRVEAVSGGRLQPCRVVSQSHGVGQQDVVDLALELGSCLPGLMRCNVWSSSEPASCMLATLPLLLLPAGCGAAAAQLAGVAADAGRRAMALELFLDLGELLEASLLPPGRLSPAAAPAADNVHALAESASNLHAWCLAAGHRHVAQLVASLAARLPDLIGHVSESSQPDAGEKLDAALAPHEPRPSATQPERPAPAPRASPWTRCSPRSLWASVKALDTGPATAAAAPDQPLTAALPPKMWSLFVMLKFVVACRRSMVSGTGLFEATALAIWTLPYALIFCCHVAGARRRRAAPAAARRSALICWLARNSRLLLHIHRTVLFMVMASGCLPVPFVLQLAFKTSATTYPIKLLYMLMESYAWWAAVPFLLLVDTPVLYVFNAWLGLPRSAIHACIVNVLSMAVHVGMALWLSNGTHAKLKTV